MPLVVMGGSAYGAYRLGSEAYKDLKNSQMTTGVSKAVGAIALAAISSTIMVGVVFPLPIP